MQKVGKGEGQLDLVAWPGYVADPWMSDFTKQTGCKVSVKEAGTSSEMVSLMRTGQYDGVSASGNASLQLVSGNDVDPVNIDLVPNYKTIFSDLKDQPYNTVDGVNYGIPHGRGANLLMWNSNDVKPAPTSWDVILDPKKASKYKGKISAYDDYIYIADAAVYLKYHDKSLGIENPYELNQKQFDAAVNLLKEQKPNVGEYWSSATKQISSFANNDSEVGTTWQYSVLRPEGRGTPGGGEPGEPGVRAEGGRDRLVGHLDDQLQRQASELHVQVDGLHRLAERERRSRPVLRRSPGAEQVVRVIDSHRGREGDRFDAQSRLLQRLPRSGPELLEAGLLLDHSGRGLRQRQLRLQGQQRLDPGVDGHQGVIAAPRPG